MEWGKLGFVEVLAHLKKYAVIARQCAHCRGNPLRFPKSGGDCHVGLRPPRNDMRYCQDANYLYKSQFAFLCLFSYLSYRESPRLVNFGSGDWGIFPSPVGRMVFYWENACFQG